MISMLKTYLKAGFKLTSISKDKVFVFEKDNGLHLSQLIKPSDDNNKSHIGIQSLKDALDLFVDVEKFYKNVKSWDFILSSPITEQSRIKFYEYKKEKNINISINFCGLVKLKDKL